MTTPDMKPLLPCPFCGGKAHAISSMNFIGAGGNVEKEYPFCEDCGFTSRAINPDIFRGMSPIEWWNTRPTPQPSSEYVKAVEEAHAKGLATGHANNAYREKLWFEERDKLKADLETAWGDAAHEAIKACSNGEWQDVGGSDGLVDIIVARLKARL